MNLILPNVGVNGETGPQYALEQNQDLLIIGSHNHGPGSGVQITPTGLNINTNLPFNNNSAIGLYSIQFSAPASSSVLTSLYTNAQSGGGITDLFYNDGAGNIIALTKAGEVNATIASLPGESYSGGTFTWVQGDGSTTPANFDIGSVTIRPNTAGTTNGVVLGPPSAISSQYNIQLPIVPGSTSFLTIDSSGNMGTTLTTSLADSVGTTMTSTGANAVANSRTRSTGSSTEGVGGIAISSSSGTFSSSLNNTVVPVTNLSVTLTTSGRPVLVFLQAASGGNGIVNISSSSGAGIIQGDIIILNASTIISSQEILINSAPNGAALGVTYPPSSFQCLDTTISGSPGSYTYSVSVSVTSLVSSSINVNDTVLVAYEI